MPIYDSAFFKKMEDIEVVLRFFALRHMEHFQYGIQGFLDLYMVRSKGFNETDCSELKLLYNDTLSAALEIFGENVFRVYSEGGFSGKPIKGLYDAVMVPLSEFRDRFDELILQKDYILEATIDAFERNGKAAITGRASTKADLENRIDIFRNIFVSALGR